MKGVVVRKVLLVILAAAVFWSGYWFVGSRAVEGGLVSWLADRRGDGWVAEYAELATRGFPNRFDTTITDLELADPRTGVAWTLPILKILALSYKPHHIIAIMPHQQTIASPYERISITNDKMRGSVIFETDTSLALDRLSFELENVTLGSSLGWKTGVQSGRFATQKTATKVDTHDIFFEASGVRPSAQLLASLDPAGVLPTTFETLVIDATVGFTAPWDRFAIERARPQIATLDLKLLQANWGDLDLHAAGELSVDGAGVPTGRITVKAQNWREMLRISVAAGVVPVGIAPTVERALELLAGMSGNPKTLDAPLSFRNGRVSFGPIPLGPAPRLIIR